MGKNNKQVLYDAAVDVEESTEVDSSGVENTANSGDTERINVFEFFKRHKGEFDKYVVAYLSVEYKDVQQLESEWESNLKQYLLKK